MTVLGELAVRRIDSIYSVDCSWTSFTSASFVRTSARNRCMPAVAACANTFSVIDCPGSMRVIGWNRTWPVTICDRCPSARVGSMSFENSANTVTCSAAFEPRLTNFSSYSTSPLTGAGATGSVTNSFKSVTALLRYLPVIGLESCLGFAHVSVPARPRRPRRASYCGGAR